MRVTRVLAAGPVVAAAVLCSFCEVRAEPRPREAAPAGQVIETRGGETVRFLSRPAWDPVEVRQDLLAGDHLRTNEFGALSILFSDRTQVRVGRRSDLVVKNVVAGGDGTAELTLNSGAVWARAERGGGPVTVQTPSVTTAIRGTDWSLSVGPDGKSTLIVFEGVVDMTNAQGSLTLTAGQAATAAIGQAPARLIVAPPDEREQMLYYLGPRDAFTWVNPSTLSGRAFRARRVEILALAPERRSTADWLDLAEIAVATDGVAVAGEALAQARRGRLTPSQLARARVVEGFLLAAKGRYGAARAAFETAQPGLDPGRRAVARQLARVSAGLADPTRPPPPLTRGMESPQTALVEAFRISFLEGPEAAIVFIRAAEKRFPTDPAMPAAEAAFHMFLGRAGPTGEALARGRALDPDDFYVRSASAIYNSDMTGDLKAAHADLDVLLANAPGASDGWNTLGLVWYNQGGTREAEAAFRKAIALAPRDIVQRINYTLMLLDQSRIAEAREQVAAIEAIDSRDSLLGLVRGRMLIQTGETDGAIENMLSAAAANPAAAMVLTGVAAAYYQAGNVTGARQALDNAGRLDPKDPVPPLMQTAIALDDYRADDAIRFARRATQLYAEQPGDLSSIDGTRGGGSYLADAYRFLGLEAWGRFQGDRLFDPFDSTSYFDQAIAVEPQVFRFPGDPFDISFAEDANPQAFSSVVQGLALNPLAAASPIGRTSFLKSPFFDVEAGGGIVLRDGKPGWTSSGSVQAFSNGPVPVAVSVDASYYEDNGDQAGADSLVLNGTAYVGAQPTPVDNVVAFAAATRTEPSLPPVPAYPLTIYDQKTDEFLAGTVWSHVFGFRNVGTAAVSYSGARRNAGTDEIYYDGTLFNRAKVNTDAASAAYDHKLGFGPLTLSAGLQATGYWYETSANDYVDPPFWYPSYERQSASGREGQIYANALYEYSRRIRLEGGLFLTGIDAGGADDTEVRLDPRIGIAVSPVENHWLRVAWRSVTEDASNFTLAPVATVGLMGNLVPVATGGRSHSLIARWDAQWLPRLFTSVEYQGRDVENLSETVPDSTATITARKARVDQIAASLNVWLGHGFGLSGTYVWTNAENQTPGPEEGEPISLIPNHFARAGLVFAHPLGIRAGLYESYVGERSLVFADDAGLVQRVGLDPFFTTDFSLTYEPPDKRYQVTLSALNLTDEDYWVAPSLPASGRTFYGSFRVRF